MILNQKQTTIAYRCPICGCGVMSMVGAFTLSADMMKLKCPCGESALTITYTPEKKIRLDVPCVICGKSHNFVGREELVSAELERTENELKKILSDSGLDSLEQLHPHDDEALPDAQIYDIVRFLVRELEADGDIECECPEGEGSYDFEILDSAIRVFCCNCGAEYIFPADSVSAAQDFINCSHLKLERPKK